MLRAHGDKVKAQDITEAQQLVGDFEEINRSDASIWRSKIDEVSSSLREKENRRKDALVTRGEMPVDSVVEAMSEVANSVGDIPEPLGDISMATEDDTDVEVVSHSQSSTNDGSDAPSVSDGVEHSTAQLPPTHQPSVAPVAVRSTTNLERDNQVPNSFWKPARMRFNAAVGFPD